MVRVVFLDRLGNALTNPTATSIAAAFGDATPNAVVIRRRE